MEKTKCSRVWKKVKLSQMKIKWKVQAKMSSNHIWIQLNLYTTGFVACNSEVNTSIKLCKQPTVLSPASWDHVFDHVVLYYL